MLPSLRRSRRRRARPGTVGETTLRELVAATVALDQAGKDFARETGYLAGLELALDLVQDDALLVDELRAELRRVAWMSADASAPAGVGAIGDRRAGYALAAERLLGAYRAAGVLELFTDYAGSDEPVATDIPAGFRSFGAPVA